MPAERPHVLIVEDDPGIAILQRRRLERSGFSAVIAHDVESAMGLLEQGSVDIVLLDYRLGQTTGLDLNQRIRASGRVVPVIMVSGAMEDAVVVDALRAGVRDVIVKTPDYLDTLPDTVRGVLSEGSVAGRSQISRSDGSHVLVVEDEPGTASLERRRLERAGYPVQMAGTAEEAHEIMRRGGVALALIDLQLPGSVSGLDLYAQWQAEGIAVPAILVTGHADQEVVIRAMRIGLRDFVPKKANFVDYLATAVDRVMAQIRVERKLAELELRLASIIGTTADAILMCDANGRVVLSNEAAQQMFGCNSAEMLERSLGSLIPGLSLASAATPAPFRERRELEAVHCRSGEQVPIEVSVTDVWIHQQRLFTVIARDISERRRAEEERLEADRRKDEFLGMLGHELRNPLAAIMNAGEVLHHRAADPTLQKVTDVVRRQSRVLARMVDDLLDLSRVTLGKIELRPEPLTLDGAVARAIEGLRDAADKAGVALTTDVEAQPLWVRADPTRIEQVLTNLVTNAIKFTPAGGRISVTARSEGSDAVVSVRDTGIGMQPSLVPRVFDLFVQGDASLDRARSGLGIGLSLVHRLVTMHGGSVGAASEGLGQGSTFTIRLPKDEVGVVATVEASAAGPGESRTLQVLVVDDQHDVADSLAVLVAAFGHTVHLAYDGASALELARRLPVDVIIADIGMPVMSGYELATRVREDPQVAHLHLLAMTGYGRPEDHSRVMAAGFDAHLTKPVTSGNLRKALAQVPSAPSPPPAH